ncbi:MAG: hypothetical protein J6A28_02070 [Clostridia bacterium]|nr:hypothetical protein [Clostridia bacterium]
MKIKPTLEIAKRTLIQNISEFNKKYSLPLKKAEIVKLQKSYESQCKKESGQTYIDLFHQYCVLHVILLIAKILKLSTIGKLELSEEEQDICAKALYEEWVN